MNMRAEHQNMYPATMSHPKPTHHPPSSFPMCRGTDKFFDQKIIFPEIFFTLYIYEWNLLCLFLLNIFKIKNILICWLQTKRWPLLSTRKLHEDEGSWVRVEYFELQWIRRRRKSIIARQSLILKVRSKIIVTPLFLKFWNSFHPDEIRRAKMLDILERLHRNDSTLTTVLLEDVKLNVCR